MTIKLDVDASHADKVLLKAAHIMADLRGFWPLVIPIFHKWMVRQFETEGDYMGSPWAKLSPGYAAWKAIAYPGKGILVATGQLKGAALTPARTATANTLILTINSPKAGWQYDQGRKLIGTDLPAEARNELEDAARQYVERALKAL